MAGIKLEMFLRAVYKKCFCSRSLSQIRNCCQYKQLTFDLLLQHSLPDNRIQFILTVRAFHGCSYSEWLPISGKRGSESDLLTVWQDAFWRAHLMGFNMPVSAFPSIVKSSSIDVKLGGTLKLSVSQKQTANCMLCSIIHTKSVGNSKAAKKTPDW